MSTIATQYFKQVLSDNRSGITASIPSVCSAHPDVLCASMLLAKSLEQPLLVEATSNQVNQNGGYTGMTPEKFIDRVHHLADKVEFNHDQLLFGGDHLGTQTWKNESPEIAMGHASELMEHYVKAGFTKIHLDCSEGCSGESPSLDASTVAERAATLAAVCENNAPNPESLLYIVGTEVPVPGGARSDDEEELTPSSPESVRETMQAHIKSFESLEQHAALSRIIGLVVQPGVEFSSLSVHALPETDHTNLRSVLNDYPGLVYEAHSTDYQAANVFPQLAARGFAIQKVGPALTFAYRRAIYSIDILLDIIDGKRRGTPRVREVVEQIMRSNSKHWVDHYQGDEASIQQQLHFSYSDRIRYYWPHKGLSAGIISIQQAFDFRSISRPALEQVFDTETLNRAESIPHHSYSTRLIWASIQQALQPYFISQPQ